MIDIARETRRDAFLVDGVPALDALGGERRLADSRGVVFSDDDLDVELTDTVDIPDESRYLVGFGVRDDGHGCVGRDVDVLYPFVVWEALPDVVGFARSDAETDEEAGGPEDRGIQSRLEALDDAFFPHPVDAVDDGRRRHTDLVGYP